MGKYKTIFREEDGVWRTISGRRVFIRKGQSLSEAMKESGKFKTKKKDEEENKEKDTSKETYKSKRSFESYYEKMKGHGDRDSWTGKEYTNDEFMEHLTDSNWHQERKMLEEANLTNEELGYIKDKTSLSKWGVGEELTGRENTQKLIDEAKEITKGKKANATMDYRQSIIKKLDADTEGLSEYDKYNLAYAKIENEKYSTPTERQYWQGVINKYNENQKAYEVDNEYIKKVGNAKNYAELDAADKFYKDKTGKNWNSLTQRDAKDLLKQLNDEGSDFMFDDAYAELKDGKLKTNVGVFMPWEDGYTNRELEIPISADETYDTLEEKMRDWQSRHDNPDSFYDEDFPTKNISWTDEDTANRVKQNKIVDSFGNNVVFQDKKGNWVTSRENYNDFVTGKTNKLGGQLALNEKEARDILAGYDAEEKFPYKGSVADEKSGNALKYKEQKQKNLEKMYKTIGYDDSKYNYGFGEKQKGYSINKDVVKEQYLNPDNLIKDNLVRKDEGKNKGNNFYVANITPDEYLNLTTTPELKEKIINDNKKTGFELDTNKLDKSYMYLTVDPDTGKVVGHNGRHRMLELKKAGYTNADILVFDASGKSTDKEIFNKKLTNQFSDDGYQTTLNKMTRVDDDYFGGDLRQSKPFKTNEANPLKEYAEDGARQRANALANERAMKNNNKINYQKRYGKDGTSITQEVKIDAAQRDNINKAIEKEINSGYPNYKKYATDKISAEMYLNKLDDKYTDTTLTTNRFVKDYLGNDKIKTDRNTRYTTSVEKQVAKSGNDYLPKTSKILTAGNSNRKEVSDNIQAHILSHYDNPVDFMEQMNAFDNMPSKWHAGQEMAKQGFYDIYYDDQRDFLNSLNINPKNKEFTDDRVFQTYTSLVGRESERLYNKLDKLYEQYKKEHKNSNVSLSDFRKWFK